MIDRQMARVEIEAEVTEGRNFFGHTEVGKTNALMLVQIIELRRIACALEAFGQPQIVNQGPPIDLTPFQTQAIDAPDASPVDVEQPDEPPVKSRKKDH